MNLIQQEYEKVSAWFIGQVEGTDAREAYEAGGYQIAALAAFGSVIDAKVKALVPPGALDAVTVAVNGELDSLIATAAQDLPQAATAYLQGLATDKIDTYIQTSYNRYAIPVISDVASS